MTTAVLLVALPLLAAGLAWWLGWGARGAHERRRRADADRDRAAAIAAEERRLRQQTEAARRVREGIEAKAQAGDVAGALGALGVGVQPPQSGG